jgi:hypothetical protein
LLPSPYAWNNFVVESVTASSWIPSTCRAYVSQVASMSRCRWMTPFGWPVDPELYSQNAMSSARVDAGSRSSSAPVSSSTCTTRGASTFSAHAASTTATPAPLSVTK